MQTMASANRNRLCIVIKRGHPSIQMKILLMTSKNLAKSLTLLFRTAPRLSPKYHSTSNKFTSRIHSMPWDLSSTTVRDSTSMLGKRWTSMHRAMVVSVVAMKCRWAWTNHFNISAISNSSNSSNRSRSNSRCKIRINKALLLNSKCMSRSNKTHKWSTSRPLSRKEWSWPSKSQRITCT